MFKKAALIACLLAFCFTKATAFVASPQPRCVSVLPNGDVTLTWSTPIDVAGTFNCYLIYSSNSLAGPFTLLDSIFVYTQTSYTHIGANANSASVHYCLKTRSGGTIAPPLDTITSIHLTVANPVNGTAVLTWNPIFSPLITSASGVYQIYQEFPTGVWTMVNSTTSLNFIDTILICNAAINYRVEMTDNTGCVSVSSVSGGVFQNTIVPAIPVFDTLSVDANNNASMGWYKDTSPDAVAYVIYQFNGTAWIPIDTVFGANNTSYTYLLSNADLASEQYRLAAFDSCGNISPLGAVLRTIHLTSTPLICDRTVNLSWTAYPSLGNGLAGYRIYQSMVSAAGPYTMLGSVSSTTTTFSATGLAASTTYYYKIEAFDVSGSKTVSSNRINFYSAIPIPPLFSYLRKVSVVDHNRVDITCHIDVAASTLQYKVMRSRDDAPTNFIQIATIPASATTPITYSDYTASTDEYNYRYKIIDVDSCGFDGMETNVGRTIFLKVNNNSDDMTNYLYWNDYESWLGNVMSYNIYRGIDGVMNATPIATIPFTGAGITSYTDDVSNLFAGEGVFNYYVEASEGVGNSYGFSENSRSNVVNAYQDAKVFIPNAFKSSGNNTVFMPVTTFVDFTEYEFNVFNRCGVKIFSTTTVHQGWDGTSGGLQQECGVYVYLLKFKTAIGEYKGLRGTVTLLR